MSKVSERAPKALAKAHEAWYTSLLESFPEIERKEGSFPTNLNLMRAQTGVLFGMLARETTLINSEER